MSDLYHGRWGIEELFRISKTVIAVDEFHSRTERGIRQELYAHFNLIAMTRLLSNRGDGLLEDRRETGAEKMTVNFKNALAIMAANLEALVLVRAAVLAETVTWMAQRTPRGAPPVATGAAVSEEIEEADQQVDQKEARHSVTRTSEGQRRNHPPRRGATPYGNAV